MKRKIRLFVFLLALLWGLMGAINAPILFSTDEITDDQVVVIPIKDTIDPGTYNFVERSLLEAEKIDAAAVIMEMNTPGGFVEQAGSIRDAMDDYSEPIYALVRPQAVSAGAYLALAADEIYMSPGSRLGNAELRVLGGGAVDEKLISDWESDMRSLAERNQRDKSIAEDMVHRNLTLTDTEALEKGYSEGTVETREDLLSEVNLSGASFREKSPALADTLVSWITNPVVATLLLALGMGGLILEVVTAGFGVAGAISIVSFGLYFGGHIIGDLAGYEVIFLFVFGVILMLVEAIMPGFGVFGVGGLILTIVSIVLAASTTGAGIRMLGIALLLAGVFLFFTIRFLSRRGVLRRFILEDAENQDSGYIASPNRQHLDGKTGEAITPIRPSGTAFIEGKRVDVVSEGEFIARGAPIIVIDVEGARVVVREINQDDKS